MIKGFFGHFALKNLTGLNNLHKKYGITITYELETETTPDMLLDVLSSDEQFFDGIKILTIHSGYTRNPLNPEEDVKE